MADIAKLGKDVLARQVMEEQEEQGYPGLIQEVKEICQVIELPDVCQGKVSKNEIKAAIKFHHMESLREEMGGKVKCEELLNSDLSKPQPYFNLSSMANARIGFRIQTKMIVCPGNMRKKFADRMECEACLGWREEGEVLVVATQSHLMVCPTFSRLRVGRDLTTNFKDIIQYFTDVMRINA